MIKLLIKGQKPREYRPEKIRRVVSTPQGVEVTVRVQKDGRPEDKVFVVENKIDGLLAQIAK